MRERYRIARARETRYLLSFDISKLNTRLFYLLSIFITLNCLDALTTLVAIKAGPGFSELNPIAAGLFGLSLFGFVIALFLKYMPIVPLMYIALLKENTSRPVAYRAVKVAGFIALIAADIFYFGVVGSNIHTLVVYFWGSA